MSPETSERDVILGMCENLGACLDFTYCIKVANKRNERVYNAALRTETFLREAQIAARELLTLYR